MQLTISWSRRPTALCSLVLAVLSLFSVIDCQAQSNQRFTGHVTDSTGAVIPGAQVTVHNQATGVDAKTVTTRDGDYSVPYITPGTYTITAEKTGFEVEQVTDILLNVDQTSTINLKLAPGAVNQTVTVNGSAVQIDLSKGDRGEIIDSERISETALDSRNPFGLFALSPGTHNFSATQYPRPFDVVSRNLYANGSPQPVDLNIDGVSNTAGGNPGYAGVVPSVDALQEFKIVLNPYDASFAKGGGNSIDMSFKSGGNQFHGTADYYMRRPWLDAYPWQVKYRNVVNGSALVKPAHKRDQYSVEADGPLIIPHLFNGKGKLFYTINYEFLHDVQPNGGYSTYSIPSPAMIAGDFSQAQFEYYATPGKPNACSSGAASCLQPLNIYDPLQPLSTVVDPLDGLSKSARQQFPGNVIPTNRISPIGAAVLATYKYITPNVNPGPNYAPNTNNYQVLQGEDDIWRNALIKVDYHVGPRDSLSFHWTGQGRWGGVGVPPIPFADPAEVSCPGTQPQSETGAVIWTHTFSPTLLLNVGSTVISQLENRAQCGHTFPTNEDVALGFSADYANQLANNNHFPNFNASGLLNAAGYDNPGPGSTGYGRTDHTLQFVPTITKVKGAHTLRGGFDIRFNQFDYPTGGNNDVFNFNNLFTTHYWNGAANGADATGYTSGSSIAELLLGYPSGGTVYNNVHQFFSQHYFAPWAQDDWKITSRLTLNLGLRWDFATAPVERHNKETGIFNPSVLNPVSSSVPAGTGALGTYTVLQGGLQFPGVNGQPRGTYYTNMLQVQPRVGFAYAITPRLSLHGGVGRNFLSDQSTNGNDGFFSSTSYIASNNNNLTPYTVSSGLGFANPIATVIQPTGSSLGYLQDVGKSISFYNPHYHIPSFWNYSMELQAQVTKRDVVSVGYVGNREPDGAVTNNLNKISPQWNAQCDLERGGNHSLCDTASLSQIQNPFLGISAFKGTGYYSNTTLSRSNFTRPYPEFGDIYENGATNNYHAWYNSLQASASHQMSRSVSLHASYTHAKDETAGGWRDELNNVVARNVSGTNDVAHSVSVSGVVYLPFGINRQFFTNVNRFVDEAINGWEFSPFYTWYSGFPWSPGGNFEMAATGGAINQNMGVNHTILGPDGSHPNTRIRGATPCVGSRNINTGLIDASASTTSEASCTSIPFINGANYAIGRNDIYYGIRQPGAHHLDIAASKNFTIPNVQKIFRSETTSLRITVDLLNAFNHANWDEGYNGVGVDFGTINKGPSNPTNLPRYLQLSAKLNW